MLLPALSETVVYEANLRAEGSTGGFVALTRRLDSIRALGANVLWLMPVQPIGKVRSAGGLGSPYATADYDAVNPEFGTPAELRVLIGEAHRRRLAVILDWVTNHTAWDNPWIEAHPDWYVHDAKGAITIPAGTNWNDVAKLDYAKPALRAAMVASMRGWVARYGIDGFRCDTADFVPADFWRDAIVRLRAASPRPLLMLAEGFRRENAASGFDLEYGWPFYDALTAVYKGAKATTLADAARKEVADGGRHLRFVTNHDKDAWEGTPLDFFRTPEGVRAATVVTALYGGGAPLVYEGQEVGWPKRIPIFDRSTIDWAGNYPLSPPGERGQGVRGPGARGSDVRLWLTGLLALRRAHPALRDGTTLDLSTDDVVAFRRRSGADDALVLANLRDHAVPVPVPPDAGGRWRDGLSGTPTELGPTLTLPPYASRVLVR